MMKYKNKEITIKKIIKKLIFEFKNLIFIIFDFFFYNKFLMYLKIFLINKFSKNNLIDDSLPKISVAITYFNREKIIHKSLFNILFDNRVSEIVILNDGSKEDSIKKLILFLNKIGIKRIKLYSRKINLGMLYTKIEAVSLCENDWVILLDSDNTITRDYISTIYDYYKVWNEKIIYLPKNSFPYFIFKYNSDEEIKLDDVAKDKEILLMLNACNFFFNKNEFLKIFDKLKFRDRDIIGGTDTLFLNYNWLINGNYLKIINTYYVHRVHSRSTYILEQKKENIKHILLTERLNFALLNNKFDTFSDIFGSSYNNLNNEKPIFIDYFK
ncbi:MAG: glycosyltransferase family 2 protein [Candidatus Nomurabacteria bacterium]